MTLNELKRRVMHLGFEEAFEDEGRFLTSLSRALYTAFLDRPRIKISSVYIPKRVGSLLSEVFAYTPGCEVTFELSGCAFSCRVSGRGELTVTDGGVRRKIAFSGPREVREHISGTASLSFSGDYSYTVTSLAVFSALSGPDVSDIPIYLDSHRIDLKSHLLDFLAPTDPPRYPSGEYVRGAEIVSGTLIIPHSVSGELSLRYYRAPQIPTGERGDEVIDMPEELSELIPLLVASYVWLDDDPEKAEYYRALYDSGISSLNRSLYRSVGAEYKTDGWA